MALWRHSIYETLTQNKPFLFFECNLLTISPFLEHYCLTLIDKLSGYTLCIPMQPKPNKSPGKEVLEALLL